MLDWIQRLFGSGDVRPVSAALQVEAGELTERITRAVSAIDRVHRDGQLPVIPVRREVLTGRHGQFSFQQDGTPKGIEIDAWTRQVELTVVHEVGHFLDLAGVDAGGQFASVNSPLLDGWRTAVKKSEAVQKLGRLRNPSVLTVPVGTPDGTVVEYPVDKGYVGYLMGTRELWARSYAQFVATRSGLPELLAQLEEQRRQPMTGIDYPTHWSDADFAPIAREMEALFRQKRWMR